MLSDRELASLYVRLEVPVVAQDIVDGRSAMDDATCYGLHDALAEQQPDSALLSIAMAAEKIAAKYLHMSAHFVVLKMEAARMTQEYGELWLDHASQQPLDDMDVYERLKHVPEDLGALSELLENASSILQGRSPDVAELCRVLLVQADSHALIAECVLEQAEALADAEDAALEPCVIGAQTAQYSDNIIQFPGV